jgi:hypothetical protein
MPQKRESYYDVLAAAIRDMTENGYTSAERLAYWQGRLREAADAIFMSDLDMERQLRDALGQVYKRLVDQGQVLEKHPGVSRFTFDKIKPRLRNELDRRILASADLIRLNKKEAVDLTLKRFAGWASSLPSGPAAQVKRRATAEHIKKSLKSLPYEQRRLLIDQGHKLTSSVNEVLAQDGGAIAARWHSHWRQPGYNYREDHKERDALVWCVRGNWAMAAGLMTKGEGYTDEITRPAEEPFCRCYYTYLYNLRQLPPEMLTAKGKATLDAARAKVAQMTPQIGRA